MTRKSLMLAAATLTMAATQPTAKPTPAPAAKPTPAATTLNCLLASSVFAQRETDTQRKELARQTLLFYLGRLDPRMSAPQLKSALKETGEQLQGVNGASLMNECLAELRAKVAILDAAGQQPQKAK